MLKKASDYTHVDVSNIAVEGDILPARDMQGVGTGAWCALKAEDAAYLAEMVCERAPNGFESQGFDAHEPASVALRWDMWLRYVERYLKRAFGIKRASTGGRPPNGGLVYPKYEFSPKYGINAGAHLCDIYPDAFILSPSMAYKDETDDKRLVLAANDVRTMFYDLTLASRIWSKEYGVASGSTHTTYDSLDWDPSGDVHTSSDSADANPRWILSMGGYDGSWDNVSARTINSLSVANLFGSNPPHYTEYVSEAIAFVRIVTYINDNGGEYYQGTRYEDIVPVACVKSGNTWDLPSGFFTNGIAEAAIARHGGNPAVPGLTRPPRDTTGKTYMRKSMGVEWDIEDAVCMCKFPSDFSELGWGWEP